MIHLIQLVDLHSIVQVMRKRFTPELIPTNEIKQSDKGVIWIRRFVDKAWSVHSIQAAALKLQDESNTNEYTRKMEAMLKALVQVNKLPESVTIQRAANVGIGRAHRQYMYVNQAALETELTVIEWMLAILYYDANYDRKRVEFKEHREKVKQTQSEEKAKKREIASLETKVMNKLERITKLEAYIKEQMEHIHTWSNEISVMKDRIVELKDEVSSE